MTRVGLRRLVTAALFLALGLVLPFFTAQIEGWGSMLLPMHLPVLLCGLVCGWKYGLAVGLVLPPLRSVLFAMPRLYPDAVYIALELAAYGFVVGLLYARGKRKTTGYLYLCLVTAMLAGRVVWGVAKTLLLGVGENAMTFSAFIAGGFAEALPGIALQLVLIPLIMLAVNKKRRFD